MIASGLWHFTRSGIWRCGGYCPGAKLLLSVFHEVVDHWWSATQLSWTHRKHSPEARVSSTWHSIQDANPSVNDELHSYTVTARPRFGAPF